MNLIQTAMTINEVRYTVKQALGDKYRERIAETQQIIAAEMKHGNCNELAAALEIGKKMHKNFPHDSQWAIAIVLAAAIEMIEGK